MRDIESMILGVNDQRVRPLVEEVSRSLNGGARRSAVVSLWVAVVVDLTNKIRVLAEAGDGKAKAYVTDLDRAVTSQDVHEYLKLEGGVLDFALNEVELIDSREHVELKRLYDDRNYCAHPGFAEEGVMTPTVESVRAHFVAAFEATFSKSAKSGKRRMAQLQEEIESKDWPTAEGLDSYLEKVYFDGATNTISQNMLKLLIKSAIIPPEAAESPIKVARRAREAARSRYEHGPKEFANALESVLVFWESGGRLSGEVMARAVGAFGDLAEFRSCTPDAAYTRAVAFLSRAGSSELLEARFFASGKPLDRNLANQFDRALMDIEADEMEEHIGSTRVRGHFVPRVIELIAESGSFAESAQRMSLLERIASELDASNIGDLQAAIENNSEDQIRPARDVEEALLSAAKLSVAKGGDVRAAWLKLAEMMYDTTNADRYYGTRDGKPYSRLLEFAKSTGASVG